jgi:hypothetical protein
LDELTHFQLGHRVPWEKSTIFEHSSKLSPIVLADQRLRDRNADVPAAV